MGLAVLSLIAIIVAIAIGFWRNINTGIVSIAFALILGQYMGHLKVNAIINFWPTNLFFILLGVTLLFSLAKVNGTLELIAKKAVYLSRGNKPLIPFIFYFLALILASIGPGNISVAALLAPIAMTVASQTKIKPILMGELLILGAVGGGVSPIAPTGIIGVNLSDKLNIGYMGNYIWMNQLITTFLFALVVYFVLGGYKRGDGKITLEKPASFNKNQWITIVGILVLVFAVIFINANIGLAAFFIAAALLLLGVGDEKKSLAGVPWGTLILVSGTGILISVADKLGGVKFLSSVLASMMGPKSATAIMTLTSGIMSFFSSASGVVMPTLIPTVTALSAKMHGAVTQQALVAAVVIGAHLVTPSPISTMGALTYAGATEDMDKKKLFRDFFIWAIVGTLFAALLAFVGIVCMK
ncbi:SLC13 family permease [Desulfosporosinus sp. FKB]|uniref:SLC13 family permease n=1 Tax=Desulfosporosinus sp. FKB TaxID=1969835 RepID=UPI000B49BF70|nr:SLC13 family permease [Desulfosporosinus sp. FKB]